MGPVQRSFQLGHSRKNPLPTLAYLVTAARGDLRRAEGCELAGTWRPWHVETSARRKGEICVGNICMGNISVVSANGHTRTWLCSNGGRIALSGETFAVGA